MARVAVVIPAYNSAGTLGEALQSVFAQTVSDFELIVVDDGSDDGTERVIAPWRSRLQYLRQENAGPAAARNAGIRATSAPLIAFLDADDWWHSHKLERLLPVFDQLPGVDLVCSDFAVQRSDGSRIPSFFTHRRFDRTTASTFRGIARRCFVWTSSAMLRRATIERLGGFDESVRRREDCSLWLRIAHYGHIEFIPEVLAVCRSSPKPFRFCAEEGIRALQNVLQSYSDLSPAEQRSLRQEMADLRYQLGGEDWTGGNVAAALGNFRASLSPLDGRWPRRATKFALCWLAQANRDYFRHA